MTHLSSSGGPYIRRRTAGLIAAGAAAAIMGLLVAPRAQADADGAYGDLSNIYGDAIAFDNSWGLYGDALFFSDLTQWYNVTGATGLGVGDPFSPGASASDDVSTIVTEGNTLTGQLTDLEAAGAADGKELPVIGDTLAFQQQINNVIGDLPTITAQEETNPALISDLSALYSHEVALDTYLINLGDELAIISPGGITSDNVAILSDALGILNDAQSTTETLTVLADLASIGL